MGKLLAITAIICIIAVTESKFSCDKTCLKRRVRICDHNGVRYRNLCEFQKAKKCAGGDPTLVKNDCDKFTQQTARNRNPTRQNCAWSSSEELPARCKNRRKETNYATTAVPGLTELMTQVYCEENCPLVFDPVCGNDGVTYPSKCVLDALSCSREKEAILLGEPHTKLIAVSAGQCPVPTSAPIG